MMKIPVIIRLIILTVTATIGVQIISAQTGTFAYDDVNKKLHIKMQAAIDDESKLVPLTVELHSDTGLVEKKMIQPRKIGTDHFGLDFNLASRLVAGRKYEVKILSTGILWASLPVDTGLTATFFEKNDLGCKGAIPMQLIGRESDTSLAPDANSNGIDDDAESFWNNILNYLASNDLRENVIVETSSGNAEVLQLQSAGLRKDIPASQRLNRAARAGSVMICLNPVNKPVSGVYNIRVKFKNAPFALSGEFVGEDISWSDAADIESSDALPDAPDDREIEKNLDLGLSFSSEMKTDSDTGERNRETVGILDLRIAPWINVIKYDPGDKVLKKWTPIYLNANISTGKITESTLSLNRIILGTEWEYRFVPSLSLNNDKFVDYKAKKIKQKCDPLTNAAEQAKCINQIQNQGNFIDYYRLKFGGKHLSDRDLKQKEIAADIEFQPVWAFLNKPRDARWFIIKDEIIPDKNFIGHKTFGWEIIPKIGFQFGKTYSRRNPAEVVDETDLIKRLYGGIEMKFDVTSRFTLKLENTLYGRYELDSDRLRNHFKGEIYTRLSSPWRQTSNGFFLSYEKGDAPPFTSTVNVFKFGYRIQSGGWNRFN